MFYLKFSYWNTFENNCSLLAYNIKVKLSGTPKCKKLELNSSEFQKKSLSQGREFKNYKNKASSKLSGCFLWLQTRYKCATLSEDSSLRFVLKHGMVPSTANPWSQCPTPSIPSSYRDSNRTICNIEQSTHYYMVAELQL